MGNYSGFPDVTTTPSTTILEICRVLSMIIPDDDPNVKRAHQTPQSEGEGGGDSLDSDGPAPDSSALDIPPPVYSERNARETSALLPAPSSQGESLIRQRFVKTFLAAWVVIWVLVASLIVAFSRLRARGVPNDTPPASVHGYCFDFISDGSPTGPSSDGLYSSQVRYAVSNTQQGHIFRSPAKYSTGSVNLTVSSEYGESIGISVTAMHKSLEVLRRISICTSRPPEGKSQSSIHITPVGVENPIGDDDAMFYVTLSMPEYGMKNSITHISHFETDMPFFTHDFRISGSQLRFEHFALRSVDAPITIEGLHAEHVMITTCNAAISTRMTVASGARLETSNGGIFVDAEVVNPSTSDNSIVSMMTKNGTINAKMKLWAAGDRGGSFTINARSTDAPLSLNFTEQPPESNLMLDASAIRGSMNVDLPGTFEGDLSVFAQTLEFTERPDATYPGDEPRNRKVYIKEDRLISCMLGSVHWNPEHSDRIGWGNISLNVGNGTAALSI